MAAIETRKTKDGAITYRVRIRRKGSPLQCGTFERISDAKKWIQDIESDLRHGRYFKTSESKKHTLAKLIDRYISSVLVHRPGSAPARKQQLLWWKKELGSYVLADVTPNLISEKKEELSRGKVKGGTVRANASVNRYLAALSHVFSYAVNEWGWMESNPLSKVKKLKEPRGRVRFLSDEERVTLLEACENSDAKYLHLVVVLALATGMRRGEVLGLTWDDVDLNRTRITLQQTKNGERRVVPIGAKALELLKAHAKVRRLDSNLLFPGTDPKIPINCRTAWQNVLEEAELKDFRFHDLRHSTASYLAMNGASLAEIAEVLGHKTLAMVKRYAHLSDSHVAGVVEKMNERIFK